jgi:hypothetical protein
LLYEGGKVLDLVEGKIQWSFVFDATHYSFSWEIFWP